MLLSPRDVEAIERATVAALAPRIVVEDDRWLIAIDDGRISRANSVTPLAAGADLLDAKLSRAEAAYAGAGLPPAFRVPDRPVFDALRGRLGDRGYEPHQPTLVQVCTVQRLLDGLDVAPGEISDVTGKAWAAAFGGEGFDPVDAASRVRALSRSPGAVYGSVRDGGAVQAVGAMSFGLGWAGIHGMRTAMAFRGQGLAQRVLAALAREARKRRVERVYLQVERDNASARALYARAGFTPAWEYAHWRPVRAPDGASASGS